MPEYYEIKIKGHLDPHWSEWFAGLKLTHLEGNETLLSGSLPDQAALYGLLERIRDLNLTMLAVTRGDPSKQVSDKEWKENQMEASIVGKKRKTWVILVPSIIILILLFGAMAGFNLVRSSTGSNVITESMEEPLNGAASAKFDVNTGTGNLTIDRLTSSEQLLVSGTLQYLEGQGMPTWSVETSNGQANLTLKASDSRQAGFRLPWAACNGETEWQIHLNPKLPSDITAYSGGGNVKINLAGMAVTRLMADTGGGNMDVVLPDDAADLSVTVRSSAGAVTVEIGNGTTGSNTVNASSGAGNVVVRVPDGIAARIHATSGMGKLTIDPQFSKIDDNTYQSLDYDNAADKIEITVESGAGDVSVLMK